MLLYYVTRLFDNLKLLLTMLFLKFYNLCVTHLVNRFPGMVDQLRRMYLIGIHISMYDNLS